MKKKMMLALGLAIGAWCSTLASEMLFNFENGIEMDNWGGNYAIVDNPSADAVNSSAKVYKLDFTQDWGRVSTNKNIDLTRYGVSFMVYAENLGDIFAFVDQSGSLPSVSQSILVQRQWVQLYFDFTGLASSTIQLQIGTKAANTVYIDNIQIVELSSFPAPMCGTGMDIPYVYGSVAIGGGGFVSGLIAHPRAKDVKYARTDVGGAYKWNAADCSWRPLNNYISAADKGLLSIESLALDPNSTDNIYMLGGCMYFSNEKTAIMYSKDGGASFKTVDVSHLIKAHGNGNGRGNGERLAVDPNNGEIIFCGGRAGAPLIKSGDGGLTWQAVASFPAAAYPATTKWPTYDTWTPNAKLWPTTPNINGTSAVVFDQSQVLGGITQRIFVGISKTGANNIYVSENAGATWAAVAGLPTDLMPMRMKMDPNGNLLIAYADKEGPNNCGTKGAIYRYNPNTKTSSNISPPGGYQIGDISVSAANADVMVATTICTWVNQTWGTGKYVHGDIIFTSTDGGQNWRSLQNNFQFDANGCSWIPDHAIHWSSSILIDPFDDNKVSVTSGNGIFTANNVWCEEPGGPTFHFDVNGLEETVALDLISIPGGGLFSVIGDYTGFNHIDIHEFAPIHKPESHTTGGIAYAAQNTQVMARVAKEGFITEDGGASWAKMSGMPTVADASYSKVAISADGQVIIYRPGGSGNILYSTDKGANFTPSTGHADIAYVAADPVNSDYFYAGAKNAVYVSSDKGKTFAKTDAANGDYTRLCAVPGKEGQIYLPQGPNGLAVSKDYGKTFTAVPFVTSCEAVGTGAGKTPGSYALYIWGKANGCDTGLYRSEDEGASWQRVNDEQNQFGGVGNGAFVVGDQNIYGRFYMATVGLGIIYGELASKATELKWSCYDDNTSCKIEGGGTEKTLNINLSEGWNLVSINVEPSDISIDALFEGLNVLEIKNMDSFWRKGQQESLNSLKTIQPGAGYLVKMGAAAALKVSGQAFTGPYLVQGYGWQLVGCKYQTAMPFHDVFSNKISVAKDFEAYWKPADPMSGINNMMPGSGYFIYLPDAAPVIIQ
jgi:xyloglucan-specific exo-beta-1,4-glucanase